MVLQTGQDDLQAVTALLLAGGASSRMGENKALLEVGGVTQVERIMNVIVSLSDEILLVANDPEPYAHLKLRQISDLKQGYGPLMGLYSGLRAASHEICILVACDMPFISRPLVRHLLTQACDYDVVVPDTADGFHPLHAVYRRSGCLPAIEVAMLLQKRRMISFYGDVRVRRVSGDEISPFDPHGIALMNVNTSEQLAAARELARCMELVGR